MHSGQHLLSCQPCPHHLFVQVASSIRRRLQPSVPIEQSKEVESVTTTSFS
jgi:hypothetical protein